MGVKRHSKAKSEPMDAETFRSDEVRMEEERVLNVSCSFLRASSTIKDTIIDLRR